LKKDVIQMKKKIQIMNAKNAGALYQMIHGVQKMI